MTVAGKAWPGKAWPGRVWQAWRDRAGLRLGPARQAGEYRNKHSKGADMEAEYLAVAGRGLTNDDAQRFGERLEVLAEQGPVTPRALVDDARPESSELHEYFEWNDETAAEAHRTWQARSYMGAIVVRVKEESEPVRAFHNVVVVTRRDGENVAQRGYLPVRTVADDKTLWAQVVADARRELTGWAHRCRQYEAMRAVVDGPIQEALVALQEMAIAPA